MSQDRIPTKYAVALLELAVEKNFPVGVMLAKAAIEFDPLDNTAADFSETVSDRQYSELFQQLVLHLQDEGFGLEAGVVTPGAFRMLCYAIISCENLGKALRRASEFFLIFMSTKTEFALELDGEDAVIFYAQSGEPHEQMVRHMEAHGLAMWHRFCGWLTGRTLVLKEVRLQGEAVMPLAHYEALFGCPVLLDQPANALRFDAACLEWKLVHTEHSLRDFLRTAPYRLMTMPVRAEDNSLVDQVRAFLGHDFSKGLPGFEEVAARLHMSAPTLRRRLKAENVTFQDLKDQCRRDAAVVYLTRPDLSINAVATLMGFTDPSAFHRSFKKWTGLPPGEYRQRHLRTPAAQ
jgi:AraC-like DNA-binding protein